jgi:hypothetical protein
MKEEEFVESIIEIIASITDAPLANPFVRRLVTERIQEPIQALLNKYSKSLMAKTRMQETKEKGKGGRPKKKDQCDCPDIKKVCHNCRVILSSGLTAHLREDPNNPENKYYVCDICKDDEGATP